MENQKNKKILIISLVSILVVVLVIVIVLKKKDNLKIENQGKEENSQSIIQELKEEIIQENSKVNVGEYVIPKEKDFTWENVEGGVAITGYTGEHTIIKIPEKINGKNVVEIKEEAFLLSQVIDKGVELKGVQIGDNIKKIGDRAFYAQMDLEEVILGKNIEAIGDNAFFSCRELKEIELNAGLVYIGKSVFSGTGIQYIELPGTLETIESGAFRMCMGLKTIVIKEGVKKIPGGCFSMCSSLSKVVMPDSLNEIGDNIFGDSDVTIYAPEGSKAHEYAQEFEYKFEKIGKN